jgi:glycosyltransferase involved in cell wall biosynthesis
MKIIFNSVFSNKTSYGIAGINTLLGLQNLNQEVFAVPISDRVDFFENQPIIQSLEKGKFYDKNCPCIRLYHQFSLNYQVGRGLFIGWPIFETTKFSKEEKHQLEQLDMIFVCSKWAKSIIEDNNIKTPVKIVHLGVNINIFKPNKPINGPFRFFFPGKFEIRKGHDIVISTFEKAFNKTDDFELVFLPHNFFIGEDNKKWAEYLLSSSIGNKIKIIGRVDTPEEVANIYNYCDCVLSFSRAEGWSLPLLEGLACGKQIISTNYSGPTEFLNKENSILVDLNEQEEAFDGVFFDGSKGNWGKITDSVKNQLSEALREVYKKGKEMNIAGVNTAKKFTWENSANQIISHLSLNSNI